MEGRPRVRAVILAGGLSQRMGAQKLLMPFRGKPLIDYAIAAAHRWQPILVAGREVADAMQGRRDVVLVRNAEPDRGMAYSLALADGAVAADAALIVLLGDKPLISPTLIADLYRALEDADVAYPVQARSGKPGHPVVFAASVRGRIGALPDGDTLHLLRDDPSLRRRVVRSEDEGAFFDVDTAADLVS